MIRARFHANADDYRSVNWPVKYPYWCSGYGEDYSIVVAFAENEEEILLNWPEATHIDIEEVDGVTFSGRFPKPDWYEED
ncbi:hypothetical protein D3C81_1284150 [compost metagenome]